MSRRLAIIPARFHSLRFPAKVLAPILGKSLLQRTYERVTQCRGLDEIIIAVDHPEVADHARALGARVVMTSPHHPCGSCRVAEAATQLGTVAEDILVNVQADEPCLDPRIIDTLIDTMEQQPEAAVTTPVTPILSSDEILSPHVVKCVFARDGRALYFSRSPIPYHRSGRAAATYYRHIGLYCFRQPTLLAYATMTSTPLQESEDLEQLRLLESGHLIYVAPVQHGGVSVDVPDDIKKVEALLCQGNISL